MVLLSSFHPVFPSVFFLRFFRHQVLEMFLTDPQTQAKTVGEANKPKSANPFLFLCYASFFPNHRRPILMGRQSNMV